MVGDAEGVGDVGDVPGDVGNLRGVTDIMFQIVCVGKGSKKTTHLHKTGRIQAEKYDACQL